ncbi:MAG TPA: hypothetical protein VF476_15705, partial [Chitinophagaceae bacterium]
MTQRDNILQELKELESPLAVWPVQHVYTIPAGYFDGLAEQVLNRIKALEATNVSDELLFLSPFLDAVSKEMPNNVPAGYFDELSGSMMKLVADSNEQTAKEELETLSPLLSGLKKEMPYSVPAGYFETLSAKPETKIVSITSRKWFRYAAAAVIVGVVATTALLIGNNNPGSTKSFAKFEKTLDKEIKKASDKELTEFVELTNTSKDLAYNDTKEV